MDRPPSAREGETAFSPERTIESTLDQAKKGARGGNMVSSALNIVRAVEAAAKAGP
jgi:hypothetical protein